MKLGKIVIQVKYVSIDSPIFDLLSRNAYAYVACIPVAYIANCTHLAGLEQASMGDVIVVYSSCSIEHFYLFY